MSQLSIISPSAQRGQCNALTVPGPRCTNHEKYPGSVYCKKHEFYVPKPVIVRAFCTGFATTTNKNCTNYERIPGSGLCGKHEMNSQSLEKQLGKLTLDEMNKLSAEQLEEGWIKNIRLEFIKMMDDMYDVDNISMFIIHCNQIFTMLGKTLDIPEYYQVHFVKIKSNFWLLDLTKKKYVQSDKETIIKITGTTYTQWLIRAICKTEILIGKMLYLTQARELNTSIVEQAIRISLPMFESFSRYEDPNDYLKI
jgi:hypothetical protein